MIDCTKTDVQKLSDEHPQRTYLSQLLKHFPKVELDLTGTPRWICPHELGLDEIEGAGKQTIAVLNVGIRLLRGVKSDDTR